MFNTPEYNIVSLLPTNTVDELIKHLLTLYKKEHNIDLTPEGNCCNQTANYGLSKMKKMSHSILTMTWLHFREWPWSVHSNLMS